MKKLAISPDEPGLPPWSACGKVDKSIWILEAASKKHVDTLTSAEISFLIFETFREHHETNHISNLTKRIKKAQVRRVNGAWQILRAGRERLQKLASKPSAKQ